MLQNPWMAVLLTVHLLVAPARAEKPRTRLLYATPATQDAVYHRGEGAALTAFMQANPDIEVVAQRIPFDAYDTQVMLAAKGGSPPDVARVNHSTVRMWAGAGYLRCLDPLIAASRVIDPKDYWPGIWEVCRVEGRQYALPLGTDCRVLYYNLTLFRKAGISRPPRTWSELIDAARRIQDPARRVYGIAFPSDNEWSTAYDALGNWLVANGARTIDDRTMRGVMSEDPRAKEAFTFVCDLVTRHRVTPPGMANLNGETIEALFANDRLGMFTSGPYSRENARLMRPELEWRVHYDTALIPAGPSSGQSGSAQGGWLIGAFAAGKYPEASSRLVEFLSRPEVLAMIAAPENLPPRRSCTRQPPFTDPFYATFFEQLPTARVPYPVLPQLPNIARMFQRAYQRAISGEQEVGETLRWLDDRLTKNILR